MQKKDASASRNENWLQLRPTAAPPRIRLFCLPHAGGGATGFRSWNTALPAFVQVAPIILPGRETRRSEPFYTDFDLLAKAITHQVQPWLDLPYAVFGHSMGSLLAFELVRRLRDQGQPMPQWLFLSGRRAPQVPSDTRLLDGLPDEEFLEELTSLYDGIPDQILRDADFMELFLPILRADISVVESHRFREGLPLDCPITAFAGMDDASVSLDQLLAWGRHTSSRFAAQVLSGGHFYPQEPLLKTISATLLDLDL